MNPKEITNAERFAWMILGRSGYNYALSDVQEACGHLDHPELKEEDTANFHEWAGPYTRRCYCGMIGYTDAGRFYAIQAAEDIQKLMKSIFPDYQNHFGEPYPERKG